MSTVEVNQDLVIWRKNLLTDIYMIDKLSKAFFLEASMSSQALI